MTDQNSGDANQGPRGVAAGIVDQTPGRGPEHDRLQDFIGRWLTVGQTVAGPEMPSVPIFASDVYEWMPGRFFVLHTAYGRIGDIDVGGTADRRLRSRQPRRIALTSSTAREISAGRS